MKINIHLLITTLVDKFYALPHDLEVDVFVGLIPLLREIDAAKHGLFFRLPAHGQSGYQGSSLTYRSVLNALGHYNDEFYWNTIHNALGDLNPAERRIAIPVHSWEGCNIKTICKDIQRAFANAEQDIHGGPSNLDVYLMVKDTDKELVKALQEMLVPA